MTQGLSKGDKAAWNTSSGRPAGKVMDRVVREADARGRAAKGKKSAKQSAPRPSAGGGAGRRSNGLSKRAPR